MAGIEGIDEVEEFADAMREVSGQGRSDGVQKARRDALRATVDDFIDILTKIIKGRETSKGGTLDSRTSPYDSGGSNESDKDSLHISDKKAWESSLVGNDMAVIFPKPEVNKRARWLEYGTSDHGPRGDVPMYFELGNVRIVLAEKPDRKSASYRPFVEAMSVDDSIVDTQDAQFMHGNPVEVEGVERQNFFKDAIKVMRSENIFEENMERELNKEFAEHGIEITGDW